MDFLVNRLTLGSIVSIVSIVSIASKTQVLDWKKALKNTFFWNRRSRDLAIYRAFWWPETDAGGEINIDGPGDSSGGAPGAELWPMLSKIRPKNRDFRIGVPPVFSLPVRRLVVFLSASSNASLRSARRPPRSGATSASRPPPRSPAT